MIVPLAHAGHWLAGMMYLLPVLVLIGAVMWQRRQDRINGVDDENDSS